ncbi:MAG: DNA repair protein RecN [Clostridiales bacterium]|nr:DNA repair protein RecN [Clostridiales bacterium]
MLQRLTIKNVALIENADITFAEGLNVLSGETGAGKSVILDSVNFVLGAKADRSMIRYGETESMVKAEFFVPENSKAVAALREMDIDSDGEIIISRKFTENGKNAIKINGNTVTAAMLRQVTDSLVDVHGQSEHFFLLKESNQLKMLDDVIGEEISQAKEKLSALLKENRHVEEQIEKLGGDEQERSRRLDILRFQIDEIEAVNLQDGEEEELLVKRNKINNLEKIISALKDALSVLESEGGVSDGLRMANRSLANIARLDEEYSAICDRLEGLAGEAEDISATLSDMGEELYFDENEATEVESRLDAIRALKRKYGANKEAIDEYLRIISEEYALLSDCEGKYAELTAEKAKIEEKIYKICREITAMRQKHGEAFCARVTNELKTLNIASAQFAIDFKAYSKEDVHRANTNGLDEICFLFSANAGEPMKPLGKIISGGEMSRFMLAVKTQLSQVNEICTYIFDEIDAGISGKTAKVVGEKLARIANNTQILAVSHLAQIAVMSDKEFLIQKEEQDGKTLTNVLPLNEEQKTLEIVRLLGGEGGDEYAYKHAEELIKQAKEYKNSIK